MNTHIKKLELKTKKFFDIIDLTEKVEEFLKEIKAQEGLVSVFVRHTTTAIKINEKEDGFFQDLKKLIFEEIVNPEKTYQHNNLEVREKNTMCKIEEECLNGHSHVAQMLLGSSSETVPVQDSKMLLGKWQRILFFELDHSKNREVVFSFVGQCK